MSTNVLLALAAGFVAGWWLKSRQDTTPRLPGGAAPNPALLSLIMQQPAVR